MAWRRIQTAAEDVNVFLKVIRRKT